MWPIHLKPLPNELFSSWLVRLTQANYMRLNTLSSIIWKGKAIWNRDIDRFLNYHDIKCLANKTGTSTEKLNQTLLHSLEGRLYRHHIVTTSCKWILPLDVYHRIHRSNGLQYCALCLAEDNQTPYYRLNWRLSIITCCIKHQKLLLDSCPRCNRSINFHRVNLQINQINQCFHCSYDLTKASDKQKDITANLIACQKKNCDAILNMSTTLPELGTISSVSYFYVLGILLRLLAFGRRNTKLQAHLTHNMKNHSENIQSEKKPQSFERLSIEKRSFYLKQAHWLLSGWPDRLHEACIKSSLFTCFLLKDYPDAPSWFVNFAKDVKYKAK